MGRTLDTLRKSEVHRQEAPAAALAGADCVTDWTLPEEEIPYIEVGGPNKQVELSPQLLVAHPPQPAIRPPHAARMPKVDLTAAPPMTVRFEPSSDAAPPTGIAPEIIAHHQPDHPVSQQYAALLDQMLTGPGVLLFAGSKSRVGTSTVLLNLAISAARGDRRVALVDAHPTHPSLAARLGLTLTASLQDVCAGKLALERALQPTTVPTLSLLPGKAGGLPTAEALTWLLAWLRERHDVVLVDGPCVEATELAALAPLCDDVYVVLPQGETPRGLAQAISRQGGRLRGLIHTHFES